MLAPQFQKFANSYDQATPIQSEVALSLAQQIRAFANDGHQQEVWADIGCGTGKLSQAVLQQVLQENNMSRGMLNTPFVRHNGYWAYAIRPYLATLIGVDNSQNMLDIWQNNCQNLVKNLTPCMGVLHTPLSDNHLRSPNFVPMLTNMQNLPFADNAVDVVMSSFALHWATPKVILELGRVVKKGGYLYLAIPVAGSFRQVSERFPQLPIYPFLPSQDWQLAIEQLIQQRQGKVQFFDERSFHHTYPNLKTLLAELKQMGGAVSGQSAMSPSVLRQYLNNPLPIDLDYQILMVGVAL
ncbi:MULTISPECIES: methyltransferase domain-containing protein [unclassified Moraxella]|uniref:methyltransferase domain-containing protein n=1 Tax=unclassified Moraxella TaxID=2685852 RepID=UPI003AF63A6B